MPLPEPQRQMGWLMCNGSEVARTGYPELFSTIGTTYGAGDGTTTFNLPDLRGEFIRGLDNSRGVDVSRVIGSSQAQDFKGFTLISQAEGGWNYSHNTYMGKSTTGYTGRFFGGYWQAVPTSAVGLMWDTSEIRPRNVAMNYIIKY